MNTVAGYRHRSGNHRVNGSLIPLLLTALLAAVVALAGAGCGDDGETATTAATATVEENALAGRAAEVFASARGTDSEYPGNMITAEQLYAKLQDPVEAAKLSLLDTRPANEVASQGSIPGALWIKMQDVVNPENLGKLPSDKTIVCISPTGHTANQVTTTLRWLGYDSILLKYGMGSWTQTPAGTNVTEADAQRALDFPYPVIEASGASLEGVSITGQPLTKPSEADYDELQQAAQEYMNANVFDQEYPFHHISATGLYDRLADPVLRDEQTFLLDIRTPETFDSLGHIEGAVNIPWRELGEPQNLAQLPKDKLIVVIGDNGRDGGQVTPILTMLGYDAVTLRSGMAGWSPTPETPRIIEAVKNAAYPVT